MELHRQLIKDYKCNFSYLSYINRCQQNSIEPLTKLDFTNLCMSMLDFTTPPSKGLGDTVAKITKATGLDKLSEIYTEITGKPCGCAKRQEALNKLFPYNIREEEENG